MADDIFLPKDYSVPSSGNKYMKFQEGENRFRILCSPILGYEGWVAGEDGKRKPIRVRMNQKFTGVQIDPETIKHFWALVVWNYGAEAIQVLSITQKGIQGTLKGLANDSDWGSPVNYDVVVTRTGKGMETEYQVTPKPAKPLDPGIKQLYKDTPINLEALFDNGDPFAQEDKLAEEVADDIPF